MAQKNTPVKFLKPATGFFYRVATDLLLQKNPYPVIDLLAAEE